MSHWRRLEDHTVGFRRFLRCENQHLLARRLQRHQPKSLAKELGPRNIRVNAINPGMVETEGTRTAGIIESDFHKQVEAQTPLGRIGQPGDIASAAVLLASSDSEWITGETLVVAACLQGSVAARAE